MRDDDTDGVLRFPDRFNSEQSAPPGMGDDDSAPVPDEAPPPMTPLVPERSAPQPRRMARPAAPMSARRPFNFTLTPQTALLLGIGLFLAYHWWTTRTNEEPEED